MWKTRAGAERASLREPSNLNLNGGFASPGRRRNESAEFEPNGERTTEEEHEELRL